MFALRNLLLLSTLFWPALGQAAAPKILVLGDSLSAAYGLPAQQGWVALLQERLRAQGYPQQVVNASISGDTTQGGLARLPAALKLHRPQWVLIELGGNDGLRGLPLKKMRENLGRMIALAEDAGAKVLLFEMRIPANYGPEYTDGFHKSFTEVARQHGVTLVPFFLGAFASDPGAFLEDGIHPGAAAQARMLDAAWPTLQKQLGRAPASAKAAAP